MVAALKVLSACRSDRRSAEWISRASTSTFRRIRGILAGEYFDSDFTGKVVVDGGAH
jgi:hypothetical protein